MAETDYGWFARAKGALVWIGVAQAVLNLLIAGPACATLTTTVLVPTAYVTTQGSDSGAPLSAIDLVDESGLTSNATKFVQFQAQTAGTTYTGYRIYTLPSSIPAGSIIQIQLRVNYRGPVRQTQRWT